MDPLLKQQLFLFTGLGVFVLVLAGPILIHDFLEWRRGKRHRAVQLTAVYQIVPEGVIAFVEELPGANTQGATITEARRNLHEAVALMLEANRTLAEQSLRDRNVIREAFLWN